MSDPIQGGCMCGAIRYEIVFPEGAKYPPVGITCQCALCRQNSGALVAHFTVVPAANVTWSGTGTPKQYASTPGVSRGFCSECGSWLYFWRTDEDKPDSQIGITTGTIDKEILTGPMGKELVKVAHQVYCSAFIEGYTDQIKDGMKWEGPPGSSKLIQ